MKLTFNRFSHERSFRSSDEFARYADEEKTKFEALREDSTVTFEAFGDAIAQNWASAAAAARREDATAQTIQNSLSQRPTTPYDSELVGVGRAFAESGRNRGARELVNFLTGANDSQAGNSLLVQAIDARAQMSNAVELDRTSKRRSAINISRLIDEHEDRFDQLLEADREEIEIKRAEFDSMLERAKSRYETLDKKVGEDITARKAEWHEAHEAFIERLRLDTAVRLWRTRARVHRGRYLSFRKWAIGFGLCGLAGILLWIFLGFEIAIRAFPTDVTGRLASYTAGSIALFTLFVWGLRVQVRTMISEDHLSTDASARSALAHTYLALTKDERAGDEDRAIVLATLFAPVSDGLVKDDGMPVFSPTAWAAQMITGQKN